MYTLELPEADRLDRYAALDIETDGLDGATDRLVAVCVGYHDGTGNPEVAVLPRSQTRDEAALVDRAVEWLDRRTPEAVVTYNGAGFDLPFLRARLAALGHDPALELPGRHVDLFAERRRLASLTDEKWPTLEECLAAYGLPVAETVWEGRPLSNARFGDVLAPRYLLAIAANERHRIRRLESVICEYARADVEATIALYEADAGRFDPRTAP